MNLNEIKSCKDCSLSQRRHNVVVGRGVLPCDILFLGEAPGFSEDVLGEAFVGMSGRLLNRLLVNLWDANSVFVPKFFITNTVLCIPLGEDKKIHEPYPDEILKCKANVEFLIGQARPKIICFIGKVAERYYGKTFPDAVKIVHPAFMLRNGGEHCGEYIKAREVLTKAFKALNTNEKEGGFKCTL